MKALFVLSTVLTVLLGVGWLFFPQAMLSGVVGPLIWFAVTIEAVLTVAFGYQLARSR